MLLAVDIGNTNITLGLFKENRLLKKLSLSTGSTIRNKQRLKRAFSPNHIEAIVICSVVPKIEKAIIVVLQRLFRVTPFIVGKDINVPIKNLYKRPGQVGQDRLINAYAGCALYKAPLIVIDFGTAVTFDVVSKRCEYMGGIIAPGIELSLNALSEKAALLPRIRLRKTPFILGKTTSESMASGIFYGYAVMCDGLVSKLKKKMNLRFNIVSTGGNAHLISRYSASIKKIDEDLILKGINLIYTNLKRPGK